MKQSPTPRLTIPTGAAPRLAAGLRPILLSALALLLLATTALGQSPGLSPDSPSLGPEKFLQPVLANAPGLLESGALQDQLPAPDREAVIRDKARRIAFAHSPGRPSCPLPPASVYTLNTNLRKYLDTWPAPGATDTDAPDEAWPEYVAEGYDDLE